VGLEIGERQRKVVIVDGDGVGDEAGRHVRAETRRHRG